jgi:acetyl-CoA acetyltransferase
MGQRAAITGIADTQVGRLENVSCMTLQADAARAAVADAGLTLKDVDGVLSAFSFTQPHLMLGSVFCEYMGIQPAVSYAIQAGGATACIAVMTAAALVESGYCRHVLVVTGDNRLSGLPPGGAAEMLSHVGHAEFERPYGISVPAAYALVARRYMHEYGTTREHFAAVAVTQRNYASLHEKAHMRQPITIADVLNSRPICEPLHLLDCCLVSDGAAAVVVSHPDVVRDRPRRAAKIIGSGQGHTHEHISSAPSLTDFGCKISAKRAFVRAGVQPRDIDVAEIYDSFTITLVLELESMGFFERGEAGIGALGGELAVNGRLPCNTHGGLLSYGHSGAAGGMFHVVEAVHQLRGNAGQRQVKDPKLAFVHGDGGILSAHCSLVLSTH